MAPSPKELKGVSELEDRVHRCSKHVCELADNIDTRIAQRNKKRQQIIKDLQKEKKEENP